MSVDIREVVFRMRCIIVCGRVWYGRWADAYYTHTHTHTHTHT
jgi:uncharacterized protein YjlB